MAVDEKHPEVGPALRFMTRNLVELPDVSAVVSALPVGRRTLERRFCSRLGVSVGRAITLVRLEIARQLLCRTRLSITAVAAEVGFSSSSHMSNVFRRELDCSPREVRGWARDAAAQAAEEFSSDFVMSATTRSEGADSTSSVIFVASSQSPHPLCRTE